MKASGERDPWDTPCKGICSTTNVGDNVCRGCGRTAEEVRVWNGLSKTEKIEINKRLGANGADKQ